MQVIHCSFLVFSRTVQDFNNSGMELTSFKTFSAKHACKNKSNVTIAELPFLTFLGPLSLQPPPVSYLPVMCYMGMLFARSPSDKTSKKRYRPFHLPRTITFTLRAPRTQIPAPPGADIFKSLVVRDQDRVRGLAKPSTPLCCKAFSICWPKNGSCFKR